MGAEVQPRRATLEDASAIRELVDEAFVKYIPRIGRKPLPMTGDHTDLIAHHDVWVLEEESEIIAVLEMYARLGYVETHRVDVQGTGAVHVRKSLEAGP